MNGSSPLASSGRISADGATRLPLHGDSSRLHGSFIAIPVHMGRRRPGADRHVPPGRSNDSTKSHEETCDGPTLTDRAARRRHLHHRPGPLLANRDVTVGHAGTRRGSARRRSRRRRPVRRTHQGAARAVPGRTAGFRGGGRGRRRARPDDEPGQLRGMPCAAGRRRHQSVRQSAGGVRHEERRDQHPTRRAARRRSRTVARCSTAPDAPCVTRRHCRRATRRWRRCATSR